MLFSFHGRHDAPADPEVARDFGPRRMAGVHQGAKPNTRQLN
ncbi:MAG: hypothetical protein JWO80_5461 [Bryobacterales bacterium]|nr:hypothetical protein [Bryobacterales bacterium]